MPGQDPTEESAWSRTVVDVQVVGPEVERSGEVLTPEALQFVGTLQHLFGASRDELLAARTRRRDLIADGEPLDFLPETADVRSGDWSVRPRRGLDPPPVEITGPTEPKMAINALNCGADVWLADLEDANTPHWRNVVTGQLVLRATPCAARCRSPAPREAVRRPARRRAAHDRARQRGLAPDERHVLVDGDPVVGPSSTPGSTCSTTRRPSSTAAAALLLPAEDGEPPRGAAVADVFVHCERELGLPRGSIRCTMLIETIPAAFEMEELLYELREHATGLNAGRWDYLFSVVKVFRDAGPRSCCPTARRSP